MNFQGIRGVLKQNYNLKHLTWLKVGGSADIFFKPEDIEDLKTFLKELAINDLKIKEFSRIKIGE